MARKKTNDTWIILGLAAAGIAIWYFTKPKTTTSAAPPVAPANNPLSFLQPEAPAPVAPVASTIGPPPAASPITLTPSDPGISLDQQLMPAPPGTYTDESELA